MALLVAVSTIEGRAYRRAFADEMLKALYEYRRNAAPVCNKPIDLGLVMDKTAGNFNVVKEFARILASKFQISDQGTHLGAIAFDSQADLLLLFSDLKGSANSLEGVNKQINKWGPGSPGEEGMITEGLSVANRFLFSVRSGMRPGKKADKVLVLLTDGVQTKGLEKVTPKELTRKMTKRGIKLFVIGIGRADPMELWDIAGFDNIANVYNMIRDGGMSLEDVAKNITENFCN